MTLTQSDIETWASKPYLQQQLLSARSDAERNGNKFLNSLLNLVGLFAWDAAKGAYTYNGKKVDQLQIKTALQLYLNKKKQEVAASALAYTRREITLSQYTVTMRDSILNTHLVAVALASGGWGNVGDPEYRLLYDELINGDPRKDKKGELAYLFLLLLGLSSSEIVANKTVVVRSQIYIAASNITYETTRTETAIERGESTPESNAAATAAQQAQWEAQQLDDIAQRAERAAKRARERANKPDATPEEKADAEELEKRAAQARAEADAAQAKSDEALDKAKETAPMNAMYERSIRHAQDSCNGCIREAARGWVPAGTLVPVGLRDCGNSCKCTDETELYLNLVAQGVI